MAAKRKKKKEPDWKAIATALAQRCLWVVTYIREPGGGGMVVNIKTGDSQHWRDFVADGLEMIPGVKIDRERLHIASLPRSKRTKAFIALEEERKKKEGAWPK